jgi:hypothetical protein
MIGPGKYDAICTTAREAAGASGAILIILGGKDGGGFSVQCEPHVIAVIPSLLERVAADIRSDLRKEGGYSGGEMPNDGVG